MPSPEVLTADQIASYNDTGYLVLERRIPEGILTKIRDEIVRFEAEARTMTEPNDRIDLEDSHTTQNPRVRRIKLPHTISPVMADLMRSDLILAPARDLIGPDLRLHTTKLNMKSANYGAAIEWHQDFAFYPHTNDDVLAVAVIIDDMVSENGPLMVFPGSHRAPIHDLIATVFSWAQWTLRPAVMTSRMRSNSRVRRGQSQSTMAGSCTARPPTHRTATADCCSTR